MNWPLATEGFRAYLLLERSLAGHSAEAYLTDIGKLRQYLELHAPDIEPHEVLPEHLKAFIVWLNELGLAASSQARLVSGLRAFFKYLLIEEAIETVPTDMLDLPRLQRHLPDVLSVEQVNAMLAAIDHSTPNGQRNRAMLEVMYACGLRVSEVCGLRMHSLYLEHEFLRVTGKGNKERIVPIGGDAIQQLRYYIEGARRQQSPDASDKGFVFLNRFGRQLSRVMVFNIVKELAIVAGIGGHVSPHTFRHSFATHLIEGGADLRVVQDLLGHESILTTEIYTHLDLGYLRETIMTYHPRNRPRPTRGEQDGNRLEPATRLES